MSSDIGESVYPSGTRQGGVPLRLAAAWCGVVLLGLELAAAPLTLEEFRALPDIKPVVRQSFGVRSARAVSTNEIELEIGMSVTPAAGNPGAYRILSEQDPAYAYGQFVTPVEAFLTNRLEATGVQGAAFSRFAVTLVRLVLPKPLKPGMPYHVVAQGKDHQLVTAAHCAADIRAPEATEAGGLDDAVNQAVIGLRRVDPVGAGLLRLELGPGFTPAAGRRPDLFTVTLNGQPATVRHIGRWSRVDTYLPIGWPLRAIPVHEVFLEIEPAYRDGDRIEVSLSRGVTAGLGSAALCFDSRKSLSQSIKVNQVGYLTDSPVKMAYLGRWMGSFPEPVPAPAKEADPSLHFSVPPAFELCRDGDGAVVFTGMAVRVHTSGQKNEGAYKVDHSGETVYQLEFTAFRTPGRYFISVPGVGRSLPFEIGEEVYAKAFKVQASGLFVQRCGQELGPPYTPWTRIACHNQGIMPTTLSRAVSEKEAFKRLPECVEKAADGTVTRIKAYGGHHDAGDYNPRSHLDVAQTLMTGYELDPARFRDGQALIPENHNGIPDLLDEAFWALRLWLDLQDPDGGVRGGTESNGDPDFMTTVELDTLGDYAFAKDAAHSFEFAGAMAQASRIWKTLGRTAEAEAFLERARRAYAWASTNKVPATEPPEAQDRLYLAPQAYAAAQLLHTTGEAPYNRDFLAACVWSRKADADLDDYGKYNQADAGWAYLQCPPERADAAIQGAIRRALLRKADASIHYSAMMGYAFIRSPWSPISWGTGAYENNLDPLLRAYKLTGDEKYRYWIIRTCDNTLGANPLGISYITGLGTRTLRAPLHNSRYRAAGEVVDGLQCEGPTQGGPGYNVKETAYPPLKPDFATLYTFVDAHFAIAIDEGVSSTMAKSLVVFGLLQPVAGR